MIKSTLIYINFCNSKSDIFDLFKIFEFGDLCHSSVIITNIVTIINTIIYIIIYNAIFVFIVVSQIAIINVNQGLPMVRINP